MTRRPHLDERDPAEPAVWRPVSSDWRRRDALQKTAEAVTRAKEARKKPAETEESRDA